MTWFVRLLTLTAVASITAACFPRQVTVGEGQPAPEIALTGATRDGVLSAPLRLEDFRGQTLVLAFFYKARTPG